MKRFTIFLVMVGAMAFWGSSVATSFAHGHGESSHEEEAHPHEGEHHEEEGISQVPTKEKEVCQIGKCCPVGNKVICPVEEEAFEITKNSARKEYRGKIYYFCCPECVDKFTKNPTKYVKEEEPHSHEGEHHEEEDISEGEETSGIIKHQITTEEVGKRVICPVNKEKLRVKESTRAVEYKGKIYYLCCNKCIKRFTTDPEAYVEKGSK